MNPHTGIYHLSHLPLFLYLSLAFPHTNQHTDTRCQTQVKHKMTLLTDGLNTVLVFTLSMLCPLLKKGGDKMQDGLELWDKSTIVHTVLPGANRYERYFSFQYVYMFLSWAKQRKHMRGKVTSSRHSYPTGASRAHSCLSGCAFNHLGHHK